MFVNIQNTVSLDTAKPIGTRRMRPRMQPTVPTYWYNGITSLTSITFLSAKLLMKDCMKMVVIATNMMSMMAIHRPKISCLLTAQARQMRRLSWQMRDSKPVFLSSGFYFFMSPRDSSSFFSSLSLGSTTMKSVSMLNRTEVPPATPHPILTPYA